MVRRGAVVACAFAAAACGRVDDPSHHVTVPLVAYTTTYANGFELITDEDHSSPTIAINLSYRVGSRDDPAGRTGMAHLAEHLMFRGSRHLADGEINKRVDQAGGQLNGHTDFDRTVFLEHVPSNELNVVLWFESDRMLSALETIDQTTLDVEREVVKNELRLKADHVVTGSEILATTQAAVFPEGHPYHHLPIGSLEDLDRVTLEEVKVFARRFYVPSNATLVLVGDFDRDPAIASVNHWFGSLPKAAAPARATAASVPIPKATEEKRLVVEANVARPEVRISWPGPRLYGEDDAEVDVFFQVFTATLRNALVAQDRLARSVSSFRLKGELGSHNELVIVLAPTVTPEQAIDAVDKFIARGSHYDLTAFDHERARNANDTIFSLEGFTSRAEKYNEYRDAVGRALFAPTLIERYDSMLARSMRYESALWFPSEARVITIVHPVKDEPASDRAVSER
jgi:zinc protease